MNLCCKADPEGRSQGCDLQRNSLQQERNEGLVARDNKIARIDWMLTRRNHNQQQFATKACAERSRRAAPTKQKTPLRPPRLIKTHQAFGLIKPFSFRSLITNLTRSSMTSLADSGANDLDCADQTSSSVLTSYRLVSSMTTSWVV